MVEGVAGGQDEPPEPRRSLRRDELTDRPAGVVAYERDVVEVERVEQREDDPGHAVGRGRRGVAQGQAVGAERQVGHDAAVLRRQRVDDAAPEAPVDERPVEEHHDGAVTPGVEDAQRSGGEVDRGGRHA